MFGGTIGTGEILIVLLVALVIFGPKKLPELGKGLGRGMRDFKRAVSGDDDEERKQEEDAKKAASPAPELPAPTVVEAAAEPKATTTVADDTH